MAERKRVVVVGAGFAGLSAVRALHKSGAPVDVTLVDRNIYATFQPLLYQVATSGLNPGDVAFPARRFARSERIKFRRGSVTGIDTGTRSVVLHDGGRLPYDYLILGTGMTTNHFGVPGAAEHSFSLYTRHDALLLRDELMQKLELLASDRIESVTVVVVGGGTTGVETAGALAELRNAGVRSGFPDVDIQHVSVVLVEMSDRLLAPYHARQREYAHRQLTKRGVDVRLSTTVKEVTADRVVLDDETLAADITVWAAGVAAPGFVHDWGLAQGKSGRITVDDRLHAHGHDDILVAGDLSLIDGQPLPQQAQPAIQLGRYAGRQIAHQIAGTPSEPFAYHDKGTMATIGRSAAVVELANGIKLRGLVAWLAWLGLHVVLLLGGRNRVSALVNLAWRYASWPSGSGLIVGDVPEEKQE